MNYTMDHVLAAIIDCCLDGQATESVIRASLEMRGVDPFDINYGMDIAVRKHKWIALVDPSDPKPSYGTTRAGRTSRDVLPTLGEPMQDRSPDDGIPERVSGDALKEFYQMAKGRKS